MIEIITPKFLQGSALADIPTSSNVSIMNIGTAGSVEITNSLSQVAVIPVGTTINLSTGTNAFEKLQIEGTGGGQYLVIYY